MSVVFFSTFSFFRIRRNEWGGGGGGGWLRPGNNPTKERRSTKMKQFFNYFHSVFKGMQPSELERNCTVGGLKFYFLFLISKGFKQRFWAQKNVPEKSNVIFEFFGF